MKSTSIHLLVTFDQNYIAPFETMLTSILLNNPGEQFHVWTAPFLRPRWTQWNTIAVPTAFH